MTFDKKLTPLRLKDHEAGRREERKALAEKERETVAKIVAWLREQDGHGYDDVRANCIEAGEHLK